MMTDYVTVLLTVISIINSALALLILFSSRKETHTKIYSLISLTTLMWIWSMVFYRLSSPENILYWTRILYICASLIASSFLFYTYLFPTKDNFPLSKQFLVLLPNIIIIFMVAFGDTIIKDAAVQYGRENIIEFGKLYIFYVIYILLYFNYAFYRLIAKYKTLTEDLQKRQVAFFFIGYFISATIAFGTNLLLPWFHYFALNWLGQVSTVLIVTFATYAIIRHQLFNIRAVAAEIFIGSLWVFVLIRLILATTNEERILSGGLFLITIFIGVYLIKSILKEVEQREKIEKLATDLEQANMHLKELDQQKSEFVSLASHQLRAPLTAIKGYGSMLRDGDFGPITDEAKDAVEKMFKSTTDLIIVVEDYLNVSRIEQGSMKYDFSEFDMRDLVATVVTELRPNLERAKLTIDFDCDFTMEYKVNADQGKIKQVIGNIIDNAIKYTPSGGLHVWLTKKDGDKILLSISDTGVGIHPDLLPRLFEKFTRAPDASKTNIMGTGLGLYVARKMIEAHHGKIWADSAGPGKGSTFFVELQAVK
jgi:signal transduction histidine kinase